jgi:hypothetical protein
MPIYKIMRIYEVPAENQAEATDRMMEALALRVEGDYHVTDYVRGPQDAAGKGRRISLNSPKGWMAAFLDQLVGRSEKTSKR